MFVAVAVNINMTSCSSSDDDNNVSSDGIENTNTSQKRLLSENFVSNDYFNGRESCLYVYEYDSNGKLIKVPDALSYGRDENYVWGEYNILLVDSNHVTEHILTNGKVTKIDGNTYQFDLSYNSAGKLTWIVGKEKACEETYTLEWNNDQLRTLTYKASNEGGRTTTYSFYYTSDKSIGFFQTRSCPFVGFAGNSLFVAHPELIGLENIKYAPFKVIKKVTYEYGGYNEVISNYTYTVKDGYITKIIRESEGKTMENVQLEWR